MNTLDVLILLVLALGLARGFSTGVIRQVASVIGLVLSFLLSVRLMHPVGVLVANSLGVSENVAPLVGFVLVFLAVQVAVFALIRLVEALVGVLKLTVVNRALGGLLGGLKAALALSVLFLLLHSFGLPGEQMQRGSAFYEPVASVLPASWDFLASIFPEAEKLSDKFSQRVGSQLSDKEASE